MIVILFTKRDTTNHKRDPKRVCFEGFGYHAYTKYFIPRNEWKSKPDTSSEITMYNIKFSKTFANNINFSNFERKETGWRAGTSATD